MPSLAGSADSRQIKGSDQVVVIVNPVAGRRRAKRLHDAISTLRIRFSSVSVVATKGPGDARALAMRHRMADLVIIAGGDGTIAEVVSGLLSEDSAEGIPVIGILPVGTANVLAAEIGLQSLDTAVAALGTGRVRQIKVGFVETAGNRPRPFLTMVGAGFDADVVSAVNPGVKRFLGKGVYVWETLRRLARPCPAGIAVTIDDSAALPVASVVVANTRYYAGRFVLAPDASPLANKLQVCLFHKPGRGAAIRYMAAMISGSMAGLDRDAYTVMTAEKIDMTAITGNGRADVDIGDPIRCVQADGDPVGILPARVWISSTPLSIAM